jgi:hypothetical protein
VQFPLDQAGGQAQVRGADIGLEDREQGGGVSNQQALAPVRPVQVGVPASRVWCWPWLGGVSGTEDSQSAAGGAAGAAAARARTATGRRQATSCHVLCGLASERRGAFPTELLERGLHTSLNGRFPGLSPPAGAVKRGKGGSGGQRAT